MTTVRPEDEDENRRNEKNLLNANVYATKKSIAQGMLDVALLTANASQLKYVLQVGKEQHEFYTIMVTLISTSIVMQVLVGIVIIILGMMNLNKDKHHFRANLLNNMVTIFIFVICVVNIIISAFGMKSSDNPPYARIQ